jgi:hypothetical protein
MTAGEVVALVAKLPIEIVKLPLRILIAVLNLVPTATYEAFGAFGNSLTKNPERLSQHIVNRGNRTLGAGFLLVAKLRGVTFKAHYNTTGGTFRGVWAEDYQDILKRWGI